MSFFSTAIDGTFWKPTVWRCLTDSKKDYMFYLVFRENQLNPGMLGIADIGDIGGIGDTG